MSLATRIAQEFKNTKKYIGISGVTSYHLLQGNLAVSNYTTTQGFNTTLYTGNGGTQSINTGIDMSTQWGNDVSEKFGGLVWLKSRSISSNHFLVDSIRGNNSYLQSNTTSSAQSYNGLDLSSTGFNLKQGSTDINENTRTYASWNFQTTHRVTGTTNHGQAYECHYNPFTGFTMVKYTGSGLAGHEIPHMLGRKLGFVVVKNLSTAQGWITGINTLKGAGFLQLNLTDAFTTQTDSIGNWFPTSLNTETTICSGANNVIDNTSTSQYILYGWANSYFDSANKLIGNYEIGVYQGTGVSGNKVSTRGKPAWIIYKRLDSTGYWGIFDNKRNEYSGNFDGRLSANLSDAEVTGVDYVSFVNDGFILNNTSTDYNASGSQYLYMVVYDTNSNGGGTYYPLASDTANIQINNALIPFAGGIDSNGAKNTILSKNETITGLTYTAGKNYVYCDKNGSYGVKNVAPNYGKTNPANGGDFYNALSNKWYTSAGAEITNGRNYLNHIVYADNDGGLLYVEELPKTQYVDEIKANEFKGKNACTAWVNIDMTTTPITIRDSYNVKNVLRTATGIARIYFDKDMDNLNFSIGGIGVDTNYGPIIQERARTLSYIDIGVMGISALGLVNSKFSIQIFGGKNA